MKPHIIFAKAVLVVCLLVNIPHLVFAQQPAWVPPVNPAEIARQVLELTQRHFSDPSSPTSLPWRTVIPITPFANNARGLPTLLAQLSLSTIGLHQNIKFLISKPSSPGLDPQDPSWTYIELSGKFMCKVDIIPSVFIRKERGVPQFSYVNSPNVLPPMLYDNYTIYTAPMEPCYPKVFGPSPVYPGPYLMGRCQEDLQLNQELAIMSQLKDPQLYFAYLDKYAIDEARAYHLNDVVFGPITRAQYQLERLREDLRYRDGLATILSLLLKDGTLFRIRPPMEVGNIFPNPCDGKRKQLKPVPVWIPLPVPFSQPSANRVIVGAAATATTIGIMGTATIYWPQIQAAFRSTNWQAVGAALSFLLLL